MSKPRFYKTELKNLAKRGTLTKQCRVTSRYKREICVPLRLPLVNPLPFFLQAAKLLEQKKNMEEAAEKGAKRC